MMRLALDRVTVTRGQRSVLRDVSAVAMPGRVTAVIGPNGAGKSTLLACAAGLVAPAAGTVRLDGEDVFALHRRRLARLRAYLPQRPVVDWPVSVKRLVALGLTPELPAFGGLPGAFGPRIDAALATHDLLPLKARPATELSGGELARAMLARATIGDPSVLIVDEPTADLDPRHAIDAMTRLRRLARDGRTVLVALHDLPLTLRLADDVIALKDGRLHAAGPTDTVMRADRLTALYDLPVKVDAAAGTLRLGD